jgi:hypothetical protein
MDDEAPKAETLNGFRTLDIRTDRLLSSWLREAGVPDGALQANEPAPDSFSLKQMESSRPSADHSVMALRRRLA